MHAREGRVDAGPFAEAREEKGQTAAKAQCCAYAVARPLRGRCVRDGFVGLGKYGAGGVWLDRALRLRLGNEGLEQGMTGWNAVLGGS